uniref:Uncharacterized protein n=1 Tax=Amphimedon queenslandica TaxID=400682 RepID=A0A1X7SIP6_AMPQE
MEDDRSEEDFGEDSPSRSESESESEDEASEEESDAEYSVYGPYGGSTYYNELYEEEVVRLPHSYSQNGAVAYPSSLQSQCFLFIIGHLREISPNALCLLPKHIRYQLLLHLPAVDVCQLEGTPVTSGITMNEIWERLCKERFPVNEDDASSDEAFEFSQITPEIISEYLGIDYSWKEIYFDHFLKLVLEHIERRICDGMYSHFNSDLLFGIYRSSETMELFDSFDDSIRSSHNVYRAPCVYPRFTPQHYIDEYYNSGDSFIVDNCRKCVFDDIGQLMKLLRNSCRYLPKYIFFSHNQLSNLWIAIQISSSFQKEAPLFLSSLEALAVIPLNNFSHTKLKQIADLIFNKIKPHIKALEVSHHLDVIYPYIAKSEECQLRKFTVTCDVNTGNSYNLGTSAPRLFL